MHPKSYGYHKDCCFFALSLSTVRSLSEKEEEVQVVQREGGKMAFQNLEWSVREKNN